MHIKKIAVAFTKNIIPVILLVFIYPSAAPGQILRGKITNHSGEAIPYATVYIQELKQGTTSNARGDYEIKLPPGKNIVVYQSLGYAPLFTDIDLGYQTITRDVILQQQYYSLPEVRISATGEDPAYIIMRKVIGLAPYYLNQVNYYKADVYLKGNLLIKKIPRIFNKALKIDAKGESAEISSNRGSKGNVKEGDSFLMESYNEIEFSAPDKYVQKVISFNSTFPDQGDEISPMEFIQASFYQPVLVDMAISPLSPDAFFHYRFRYLGSSPQGNFTINKIEVIPKRKSQQLFYGTIYIIEDLWCLHSLDLTNENLAGIIKIQQLYIPVHQDVWLPVSHKFDINLAILGFRADAGYGSSVKYLEVKPNLALEKPKTIPVNYAGAKDIPASLTDTASSKEKQKIDRILSRQELTNRDMVRLSRLMRTESERSLKDSANKGPEIIQRTKYIIEKDAAKKDSAWWAGIRPIPLSESEIRSIKVSDSTKTAVVIKRTEADTVHQVAGKQKKFGKQADKIISGHTWSGTSGLSFSHNGLIDLKGLSFNTVDGFIYGTDFRLSRTWNDSRKLIISPDVRWAFSRERLLWVINASYLYNPMKQGLFYMQAGQTDRNISTGGGINTLINSLTTLFLKKNYLKLYDSRNITVGLRREIINGMYIDLSGKIESRKVLENTTTFSLSGSEREYAPNLPVNRYLNQDPGESLLLWDQRHAEIVSELEYTPGQKYRIAGNTKIPSGSDYPTFSLLWKHGINESEDRPDTYRHFDMIRIEASNKKESGAYSEYRWRIRAGGFLNNDNLSFYDFAHFNTQSFPLLLDDFEDAFMIPSFYSQSTPELFSELHFKYTTPYLLLKLLPGISRTLIRENISVSHLSSHNNPGYTELGYSLSEILFMMEIGIYAGFDDLRFRGLGAKVILRFN
jgi:hypothetical protein